ncbi:hypothetical protein OsJ_05351 [Oryza sativa Japonica Group]|uniref:Uncharacterized protein n=1 Tax=Oryza sativa subsp. japonica TaxID=39947 RepID=B9F2P1_ORYSJ|nr:hypothetical protein OsJ_05351 [Oryza sativa Japonica Group]
MAAAGPFSSAPSRPVRAWRRWRRDDEVAATGMARRRRCGRALHGDGGGALRGGRLRLWLQRRVTELPDPVAPLRGGRIWPEAAAASGEQGHGGGGGGGRRAGRRGWRPACVLAADGEEAAEAGARGGRSAAAKARPRSVLRCRLPHTWQGGGWRWRWWWMWLRRSSRRRRRTAARAATPVTVSRTSPPRGRRGALVNAPAMNAVPVKPVPFQVKDQQLRALPSSKGRMFPGSPLRGASARGQPRKVLIILVLYEKGRAC